MKGKLLSSIETYTQASRMIKVYRVIENIGNPGIHRSKQDIENIKKGDSDGGMIL